MGEGGSSTIKLAAGETLFFFSPNYHWQMRVPRLTRFALTTWSISIFTCKYYPFDSNNRFSGNQHDLAGGFYMFYSN